MSKPLNILLLTQNMALGGSERVLLTLLTHLDRTRFSPTLVTFDGEGALLARVPADVPQLNLGVQRARQAPLALARLLRAQRPGLILASQYHTGALAWAARGLSRVRTKIIVRCAFFQPPGSQAARWQQDAESLYRWSRWLFPKVDGVIAQTQAMRQTLLDHCHLKPENVVVLPNPLDLSRLAALAQAPNPFSGPGPHLVTVGRMDKVKDHETLLAAFALFRAKHGGSLTVIGGGPCFAEVQQLARPLGEAVCLPGAVENPFPYVAHADLFVLTSRFESFPNALLEAHALGVPCVSTDCPDGPREIIVPGKTGLLCPVGDAPALASAMTHALGPDFVYERAAAHTVAARHDAPVAVKLWEGALRPCVENERVRIDL